MSLETDFGRRRRISIDKDYPVSSLSSYLLHMKIIKSAYNNNKLKISAPTWNGKFDLPDGSYSVADIQG